jgi:hypothetical protein
MNVYSALIDDVLFTIIMVMRLNLSNVNDLGCIQKAGSSSYPANAIEK